MLIGILGERVPDEFEDLDDNLLRHSLDAIIKLGLTKGHSSETELRLGLNKPCFNVIWPERGQLHSNAVEKVCGGESGGNSLKDGWIFRHIEQMKRNTIERQILTYLCKPVQKTGRQIHLLVRIESNYK